MPDGLVLDDAARTGGRMSEMLRLPEVSLVMVETREHSLADLSVQDSMAAACFGEVIIFTDKPEAFPIARQNGARFVICDDFPSKLGWAQYSWYGVPPHIQTAFCLQTQWDSWVVDPLSWKDEFLKYDYCGAPWGWYKDGLSVGNSGFSLISTALKRYMRDKVAWQMPCVTDVEDDLLCRKYRPILEASGFRWAPEALAHDFAFECCRPAPDSRHFGFHALMNFPAVLEYERLLERMKIVFSSKYISNPQGYILKAFCQNNPDVARRILADINVPADSGPTELLVGR